MKIVGSLTTLPSRINDIGPTLRSIHSQSLKLEKLYLGVPSDCKRLGTVYPDIPREYYDYCTPIYLKKDYGPVCKILGGLLEESDPEVLIVTFDDDIIYPRDLVETLVKYYKKNRNCAIGSAGFRTGSFPFFLSGERCHKKYHQYHPASLGVDHNGKEVDVIAGYSAALYSRKMFPKKDSLMDFLKHTEDEDIFRNDDVLISSWLCKNGYKRLIFPISPLKERKMENRLSSDAIKFISSCTRALSKCEKRGLFIKRVPISPLRTASGLAMAILVLALLVFLLVCFS